jgi:hypothetical protein
MEIAANGRHLTPLHEVVEGFGLSSFSFHVPNSTLIICRPDPLRRIESHLSAMGTLRTSAAGPLMSANP